MVLFLHRFLCFVSEVGGSVSASGGYGGFTGSFKVDISKFNEAEETKKETGEKELTYTIGGDDLPEPIQIELMGIEETLQERFWSNLKDLQTRPPCKQMSLTKLKTLSSNMGKAIGEYPHRNGVHRPTGVLT